MKAQAVAIAAIAATVAAGPAAGQEAAQSVRPKAVISQLAESWSFEMFFRGRDHPLRKGQREMRLLADSVKLSYTDEFDGSSITGAGFLGYDERFNAYYLMSVQTDHSTPMYLLGHGSGNTIRFDPERTAFDFGDLPVTYILSEIRITDSDHFEWVSINGEWRVEFARVVGL